MTDPSIIIATYNRQRPRVHIIEALERQSLPIGQVEVLIVDDAATRSLCGFIRGGENLSTRTMPSAPLSPCAGSSPGR
jgi:hypothetical protein